MTLLIKKINEHGIIPTYGSKGAACFDMYSSENVIWKEVHSRDEITRVGKQIAWEAIIPTALAFEIEEGYRMDIYPRSGWGFKYNIQLANGTGKIDSDYRGEVKIKLIAFCKQKDLPKIERGSRVAQAEINEVIQANFKEVQNLSNTERGEEGFGSTGTK